MRKITTALLAPALAVAQAPTPSPAERTLPVAEPVALPGGPLVCFEQPSGGDRHVVTVYIAARDGDAPAAPFWHNDGNVDVLRRLDRDRLLLASYGEPYGLIVVDVARGTYRLVAEGSPHDFVAVHGDDLLYLGDNRWGKGDNRLYAVPWRGDGPPRRLCEQLFTEVPVVAGNLALGITAAGPHPERTAERREVWAVSLTRATGRRVHTLPSDAFQTRLALSPGGQRLAVGASTMQAGTLAVVDLGAAKVLREWRDLPVELSMLSSFAPTVEVAFHGDGHVVCSETRGREADGGQFVHVRRSIETGEVVDEQPYMPIGLYHRPPTPTRPRDAKPPAPPLFRVEGTLGSLFLFRRGEKDHVGQVGRNGPGRILLSPGGSHALVRPADDPQRCLLHRADPRPLALFRGRAFDFVWLPASAADTAERPR